MSDPNVAALLRWQAERLGPRIALRWKQHGMYRDLSWRDYHEQSTACAAALLDAGIEPGERVGLLAENRHEWLIADMGILAAGAVNVSPHAPLTARQVHYEFEDAEVRWLIVSTTEQLAKVRQIRKELPLLRGVVVFESKAAAHDAQSWEGFLQQGRRVLPRVRDELRRREAALTLDDLATLMYTSGTTGNPKGVMLTHGNLLSNATATNAACARSTDSVLLSWLPFSHIYARTCDHYLSLLAATTLCLATSAETLVLNLREIQPTHLSSVPRFYEKVLAGVASTDPAKTAERLRSIFGPRLQWLNSGGAPLPLAVAQAYHDAGILLLQGYGLTESSPVISFNRPSAYKLASVGQPIPGVEVKIAPDGEVLTRGPHVMRGYWKNPQATAEAIREGWLHTGDLGKLDEEGFLAITGRKKEILVLSTGKKVVPSYLEGLLLSDPLIDQAVVAGEGKNFLTALVVPHWENLRRWLQDVQQGLATAQLEELASHPTVVQLLRERIDIALREVSPGEQIKKFTVLPQPFSVAAEELTVSLKLRRGVVLERYRLQLEVLYATRGD